MSLDVGQRSAFEGAIEASPDDADRYAVYGDWLSQLGDVRGELISLQLQQALSAPQRHRVEALLQHPSIRCLPPDWVQWRWGFVVEASLPRDGGALVPPELVDAFFAHPSARFVRTLALGTPLIVRALEQLRRATPAVLRVLRLTSPRSLDLAAIPPSLGAMQELHLNTPTITNVLGAFDSLRVLSVAFLEWSSTSAAQLFGAVGPGLEQVRLTTTGSMRADVVTQTLARTPSLEALTLSADETGEAIIDALEASPTTQHLATLDLSRSGLTERAAHRLMALSRTLPRLSTLVLGEAVDS